MDCWIAIPQRDWDVPEVSGMMRVAHASTSTTHVFNPSKGLDRDHVTALTGRV